MIKTMLSENIRRYCFDESDKNRKLDCSKSDEFKRYFINLNKTRKKSQMEFVKDSAEIRNESASHQTKSKSNQSSCKRLYYVESDNRRKYLSNGLNMSNIIVILFIMMICCCWNSVVYAFHLNEESNSVYPKMKSIPSSSYSHKRHSKTVEVFYQSGVSFYLT